MSVWKPNEKLPIFALLISHSKHTVFHHHIKHLEVRQKYSAARRIFNSLLSVSSLIHYSMCWLFSWVVTFTHVHIQQGKHLPLWRRGRILLAFV